ncbi:hypothetical protein KM043_015703 [Ampulex compressa]|nr:hypothetical protein KM043_015703 [Ampulex compressa]
MADVRLLIQEEGRAARNLIAFNVPVGTNNIEKVTRKPPSVPRAVSSNSTKQSMKATTRVRSASTGRDKKSELQARYWAFLFGNLQRAVDGIYQTCEEDENISECKEAILVLENYTRDFHNLIEWFKVKWAYEKSPPPLRRTPLAWEVRKTSPCRIWTSSMIPKSTSPLQRVSPTESLCRSPIEQIISENKPIVVDNKMNHVKEESVRKVMKENKNNVSKRKEHIKLSKEDKLEMPHYVQKKILSNKNNLSFGRNEINVNVKKQTRGKDDKFVDMENVIAESDVTGTSHILTKESTSIDSLSKNAHNATGECNKANQGIRRQPNNEANHHINNNVTKLALNPLSSNVPNKASVLLGINKLAYSTVSQTKSTASKLVNPPETAKFTRSKTTLSDRHISSTNKTRPGTSVIISHFEPIEKKISDQASLKKDVNRDINGSVEVLTKQTVFAKTKDESDGWQTVRSRCRRGSTHNLNISMRFHKPSTATSLPALSIESPFEKNKKNCLTPDGNCKQKKKCLVGKAGKNMNNEVEKVKGESVTTIAVKSNVEEILKKSALDLSKTNSTSMIAAIFKNDAELLEKRIQQFMAAQAERERIILEEERKTEEADSQRSQQLSDEEASLQRQIFELECTEIDIDTETDETDGELVLEMEDETAGTLNTMPDDISLEDRYENMLEGMTVTERVDTLAQLHALVARHPGRALELHQKLSSPSRKRSLPETLRRYQAKQACAQYKRQKLLMEKSQRLRELLNKVEDVKSAKSQLIEDKRIRMEMKLKRAEENRTQHLLEIVRKAHDEDSKLKEIAFINELEAQNKRHDFMALCQEQEERLQGIQEERQRRQEEKAAKEAAAEERRRALEAERQLRIQKMKQARREREERVGKMQLEREKERQELAREKARDREERLSALHAAQLANQEELQKKIAQKQQESARRHVENIEHIRQRAVESSILKSEEVPPTLKSYSTQKQCSLCSTLILNEVYLLSHLKGKAHLEAVRNMHDGREPSRDELQRFNISQIRDVSAAVVNNNNVNENKLTKEKQKALKRRCRKVKQRLALRGQEWENICKNEVNQSSIESTNKAKFRRNLKELERLYENHLKSVWSSVAIAALERCSGEITRAFFKCCPLDQDAFRSLNGFDILTKLLNLSLNTQSASYHLPDKCIISLCRVYKCGISGNSNNIEVILCSNKVITILDLLLQRLELRVV